MLARFGLSELHPHFPIPPLAVAAVQGEEPGSGDAARRGRGVEWQVGQGLSIFLAMLGGWKGLDRETNVSSLDFFLDFFIPSSSSYSLIDLCAWRKSSDTSSS